MPQIIVTADHGAAFGEGAVTFRERVTVADFESDHFSRQLVERLGWAVGDADAAEHTEEPTEPTFHPGDPVGPAEPMRDRAERISAGSPA